LARGYEDPHLDSPRVRFRRALVLGLMTVLVPGSAQLAVGRRWVGAVALTVWVGVLGALGYLFWRARSDRAGAIDLVTNPDTLLYLRFGLIVLAVGWLALFIHAWRISGPRGLSWPRAVLVTVVNVAIIGGVAGSAAYASQLLNVSRESIQQVFPENVPTSTPLEGRYNILLVGSDSGPERTGVRPDSLTVASIDTSTGRTVLVSMPRNLQNVPFPDDSPMHALYPYGYNCGNECLLNAVHTAAENRADLYPDSDDPGLDATIDAVEGITDLKINYYLMVNLKGFRTLINALGGVEMDVKTRIAMFGHDDAWKQTYIEPGLQKLDGQQALWYARSRVQSDDYTRMGRQKCLMAAMVDQLDPTTAVTRAIGIAKSGKDLLSGNMPRVELGKFADLALRSRGQKIITVSLVPPDVDVTNPDFAGIQTSISDAIERSEKVDAGTTATATPSPTADATSTPDAQLVEGRSANNVDDLQAAC
jgi:LCP family protein required for cell wall assembly